MGQRSTRNPRALKRNHPLKPHLPQKPESPPKTQGKPTRSSGRVTGAAPHWRPRVGTYPSIGFRLSGFGLARGLGGSGNSGRNKTLNPKPDKGGEDDDDGLTTARDHLPDFLCVARLRGAMACVDTCAPMLYSHQPLNLRSKTPFHQSC